jgi:hypothetical protein
MPGKCRTGRAMASGGVITAGSPKDTQRCYSLHANAYVTKPKDFDGMSEVIRQIAACFLDLIKLPD